LGLETRGWKLAAGGLEWDVRVVGRPFGFTWLAMLTCLFTGARALPGTTIVGFRTADAITIGADGREIAGREVLPDPVCKIYQSGKSGRFWASAQLWKDPETGFSVEKVVNGAGSKAASLSAWVAAFDSRIVPELERTIRIAKKEDAQAFRETYAGRHVLEIVFFGLEQSVPVIFYRDYRTDAKGRLLDPAIFVCPGAKCNDPVEHFCLGECAQANAYKKAKQMRFRSLTQTIREEISAEIRTDWTVGPPIDVLRIDKTGARWIGRKPDSRCPPIKHR
jgi:hypothetical protein